MYEGVSAKDKRMVIDAGDWSSRCSSYVGEDCRAGGIGAEGKEIRIVQRRLGILVQRGSLPGLVVFSIEGGLRRSVPG